MIIRLFITLCILSVSNTDGQAQTFEWMKSYGQSIQGGPYYGASVLDTAGNIIIVGRFNGIVDFDPGPDTAILSNMNSTSGFILKLDSLGNFIWVKGIESQDQVNPNSVAIDDLGNIVLSGTFRGLADFDPGIDTFALSPIFPFSPHNELFILKLGINGNFMWAKGIGSQFSHMSLGGLKVGPGNSVMLAGQWGGGLMDFNPSSSLTHFESAPNYAAFVLRLSTNGIFAWVKILKGITSSDKVGNEDMDVDTLGNIYVMGSFEGSADFNPGISVNSITSGGDYDVYICKLSNSGAYIWAKHFSGLGWDYATGIAVDAQQNVYTVGHFSGLTDFDPGSGTYMLNPTTGGPVKRKFISKLNSSGGFEWVKNLSSTTPNYATDINFYDIAVNKAGEVFTSGNFKGTLDFGMGNPTFLLHNNGPNVTLNGFLLHLTTLGDFVWAKQIISQINFSPLTLLPDENANTFVFGTLYDTTNFDYPWFAQYAPPNNSEIFIAKYGQGIHLQITETVCDSFTAPLSNNLYTTSGTYVDSAFSTSGQLNRIEYILTVNHSNTSTFQVISCGSYLSPSGKFVWQQSGSYLDTLATAQGCDSILNINLIIAQSDSTSFQATSCKPFVSPSGKFVWQQSGSYLDTLATTQGCDSILYINLTVTILDTAVSRNSLAFTAQQQNASYQWLDCTNGFAVIPSETGQTFTATTNGSFAVEISENGCVDTSSCFVVNNFGIDHLAGNSFVKIYPNPASSFVHIDFPFGNSSTQITLYNQLGQIVYDAIINKETISIPLPDRDGVYVLKIETESQTIVERVLKMSDAK